MEPWQRFATANTINTVCSTDQYANLAEDYRVLSITSEMVLPILELGAEIVLGKERN